MEFEKIKCVSAFYDEDTDIVFYNFSTIPQIENGDWAISEGGDVAYNTRTDRITQDDFPPELLELLPYIDYDIEVEYD
nr:MAG TPA: hypothetical protein [Caudoviricetes sp.]